jgi:adenine-specific DNA-methyltransferase
MSYDSIQTIRYMGNKTRLLGLIVPAIAELTPAGGTVCDLCFGSGAVSYALKREFRLIACDVQQYCLVLARALIVNQRETISAAAAARELDGAVRAQLEAPTYTFFADHYADAYFAPAQCRMIDALRAAIGGLPPSPRADLYLAALMGAMCRVQSTPGHFAQFMPAAHPRVQALRAMDLRRVFAEKCDEYASLVFSPYENRAFCCDFHDLLARGDADGADTLYLDSPYTGDQYSRFYHVLETAARGDAPAVRCKARYRTDRFLSGFCYKNRAETEFRAVMDFCAAGGKALAVSYSDRGVLPLGRLEALARARFRRVETREADYAHSSQGKGPTAVREYLLLCR